MQQFLMQVPFCAQTWEHFTAFYAIRARARGEPVVTPPPPVAGLFMGTRDELIAGICFYPTEGPYFVAEHFSTNPRAPARLRHRAACLVAEGISIYGAATGKYALIFPSSLSMRRILQRAGFEHQKGVTCWSRAPWVLASTGAEKVPAAPTGEARSGGGPITDRGGSPSSSKSKRKAKRK